MTIIKAHPIGHALPFIVKGLGLTWLNASKQVIALRRATLATYSLTYHFPSLTVKHAFMCHFLVASCRVLIHLMSFGHFIVITKSALGSSLISFAYRIAIGARSRLFDCLHLCESTLTFSKLTHLGIHHRHGHCFLHIFTHFADHFVHLSKRLLVKERIIGKWITSKSTVTSTKRFHHGAHHIFNHIALTVHAFKHAVEW